MSELEKAKQEVEQVCFAYDKAGDTGDIKDWKDFYDLENKLIEKFKISNQPQLTIKKSIADKADKTDLDKIYCFGAQEFYWLFGHEHDKYVPIIFAYLAGKALGVDLVKVVEG